MVVDEPRPRPITCEPWPALDPSTTLCVHARPSQRDLVVRRGYPGLKFGCKIIKLREKKLNKDSLSNGERTGKALP
ncbi:hypothetical protein HKD37_U058518 [Glycine soja]